MTARYKDNTYHMMDAFNLNHHNQKKDSMDLQNSCPRGFSVKGRSGSTWDAHHMNNFLSQSNYSNWEGASSVRQSQRYRKNSTGNYFFKTVKDDKNASKIGFTKINPLVSSIKADRQKQLKLQSILNMKERERYSPSKPEMREYGNFKFTGNSIKFRKTDPVTLQHNTPENPSAYEKQRLLYLINKRHPHGITGIDHPENPESTYYGKFYQQQRIRVEPNSHRAHVIDRDWKSKGRVSDEYKSEYGYEKGQVIQERKFRNTNMHGYNIINNRKIN